MSNMKKILTFGVFDYFHYGHLVLLKNCASLGDYLIVAVHKDEDVCKTKPSCKLLYDLSKRIEIINSIKFVNEVIPYSQVEVDIEKISFDILVVGPDQNHIGFQKAIKWAKENSKQVIVMPRTPGISSTKLRKGIK